MPDVPPTTTSGSPPPARFIGPYQLERLLANKEFGKIWLARDPRLEGETGRAARFVLKELRADAPEIGWNLRNRFYREAAILKHLTDRKCSVSPGYHGRIHGPSEGGQESDYIVEEFVEGASLAEHVDARAPLSVAETSALARALLAALAELHAHGVIHRDLSPGNVVLPGSPTGYGVRLIDFGWSHHETAVDRTLGPFIGTGTPPYWSPEQQPQGSGCLNDPRTDLYAAGVILLMARLGRDRLRGDSGWLSPAAIHGRVAEVEPCLQPLLGALTQPEPRARPADARAALRLLPTATKGRSVVFAGLALLVVAALAAVAVLIAQAGGERETPGAASAADPHSADAAGSAGPAPADSGAGGSPGRQPQDVGPPGAEKPDQAPASVRPGLSQQGMELGAREVTLTDVRAHLPDDDPTLAAILARRKGPRGRKDCALADDEPLVCVTFDEAQSLCEKMGGRLPSQDEWTAEYRLHPVHGATRFDPQWHIGFADDEPRPGLGNLLQPPDAKPPERPFSRHADASASATFCAGDVTPRCRADLLGNVLEWAVPSDASVVDIRARMQARASARQGETSAETDPRAYGVLMGRPWRDSRNVPAALAIGVYWPKTIRENFVGFRCMIPASGLRDDPWHAACLENCGAAGPTETPSKPNSAPGGP